MSIGTRSYKKAVSSTNTHVRDSLTRISDYRNRRSQRRNISQKPKLFLIIFLGIATLWYAILYTKIKKINLVFDTPIVTMKKVANMRLSALVGEVVGLTVTTVFFTLLLTHLWSVAQYKVWLIIGALIVAVIFSIARLRQNIRDFNNLTAID